MSTLGPCFFPTTNTPHVDGPYSLTIGRRALPTRLNTLPFVRTFMRPGRGPWNAPGIVFRPRDLLTL